MHDISKRSWRTGGFGRSLILRQLSRVKLTNMPIRIARCIRFYSSGEKVAPRRVNCISYRSTRSYHRHLYSTWYGIRQSSTGATVSILFNPGLSELDCLLSNNWLIMTYTRWLIEWHSPKRACVTALCHVSSVP